MSAPRISVVMSVFNGLAYLDEAVRSVLAQTFRDFEFLIVDDGSTDGSADRLRRLADEDMRIRVFTQDNAGLAVALNRAIAAARGDYLARMDADDVSRPGRFAAQVAYLDAHPRCAVVGTGYIVIDAAGRRCGGTQTVDDPRRLRDRILTAAGNPLCHGSVMIRAAAVRDLRPVYRSRYSQDFDLWVRLLAAWDAGMVDAPLYLYREHDASVHGRRELVGRRLAQREVVLRLQREGRLFDNEAFQREVAALYGAPAASVPPAPAPAPPGRTLHALFFDGDFAALRRECRRMHAAGRRSRQLALFRLLSALPVGLVHRGYDGLVRLEQVFLPFQRRLRVGEINGRP